MKKLTKSIIASILCAVIAITAIATVNTTTAYAADDKTPFKVTFNKKTITLADDLNDSLENGIDKVNVKTLKKKWGSKPEYEGGSMIDPEYSSYEWKKGKTKVSYFTRNNASGVTYNLYDKNSGVCGIKIGAKKATVLKKLKTIIDAENIQTDKNSIFITHKTDDGGSGLVTISFSFKNGKLTNIMGTAYVGETSE